jgi:hypothetical protein
LGQEKGNDDVSLVVISSPTLLRETIDDDEEVMRRICTLYASDTGVIYSGAVPTTPAFYEVCATHLRGTIRLMDFFFLDNIPVINGWYPPRRRCGGREVRTGLFLDIH